MRFATSVFLVLLLIHPFKAHSAYDADSIKRLLFDLRPTSTPTGGSGLINLQTFPTNTVGTLAISGYGFIVDHDVRNIYDETVTTGVLGLTYSATRDLEVYFSASYYSGVRTIKPDFTLTNPTQGIGSQELGFKYRFPLRRTGLLQMGTTVGAILGISETKVTGYNFFYTRRQSDIKLRLIQSLLLQNHYGLPNLHFNEGYLTQYDGITDLLMLGVGSDYLIANRLQLMLEFESRLEQRTPIYFNEDYMVLTTAIRYFTAGSLSLTLGSNFGLSKDRVDDRSWRRSDPWQAFLGITFTPKVTSSDLDRDGIPDWLDAEMNPLPGYPRDQYGQPLDTDMDGVPDGIDREPTTIRGAVVDEFGVALDDDGDGVPNGIDRETRTPEGAWVDALGVAYDTDRDGVPDGIDEEPTSPWGALVDKRGVARDSDGDGVPDGVDLEANSPAGALVDAWGRSLTQAPAATQYAGATSVEHLLPDVSIMRLSDVHFTLGRADIRPEDYSTLDIVGQTLSKYPMLVVLIEGHADSTGSVKRNEELSYERARAVRDYLTKKFPALNRSNFTIAALGERDPLTSNTTEEGRIQNRRVEFKVLNREVLQQEMITTWE